eukprot:6493316-Heterocapsa_arctica.AAC.1
MAVRWAQQGPPSVGRRDKITTYNCQQPGDDARYQGLIVLLVVTILALLSFGVQLRDLLRAHQLALVDTWIPAAVDPTWTGGSRSSRIDFIALPDGEAKPSRWDRVRLVSVLSSDQLAALPRYDLEEWT